MPGIKSWKSLVKTLDHIEEYRTHPGPSVHCTCTYEWPGVQTLTFLYAKAKINDKQRGDVLRLLSGCDRINQALRSLFDRTEVVPVNWLPDTLLQQPSHNHRQATVEALAFARWLSRFAEAELPSEEGR